jgi:hypothetical protein
MSLSDYFPVCSVINLPERTDRRREVEKQLARIQAPAGWAQFFPAIRPTELAGFPSFGAHGCFLSHLGVLKRAAELGAPSVLILEDDLEFEPWLLEEQARIVETLRGRDWDFAYLGHVLPDADAAPVPGAAPFRVETGTITTTHFVAINGKRISEVIRFLETVLSRPPGHPDGGPMHVDGAYSTFRFQNPDVVTLVATPSLGGQMSSRSDVTPNWKDRIPVLRALAAAARSLRRRMADS